MPLSMSMLETDEDEFLIPGRDEEIKQIYEIYFILCLEAEDNHIQTHLNKNAKHLITTQNKFNQLWVWRYNY
jgi:hypothetical protein